MGKIVTNSVILVILMSGIIQSVLAENVPYIPTMDNLSEAGAGFPSDARVRSISVQGSKSEWMDLRGNQVLIQSLPLTGVNAGDIIKVRSEFEVTNNVATKESHKGSKKYRGENRYDVNILGALKLSSDANPQSGRQISKSNEKVSVRNHHGLVVVSAETQLQEGDQFLNLIAESEVTKGKAPKKGMQRKSKSARKHK